MRTLFTGVAICAFALALTSCDDKGSSLPSSPDHTGGKGQEALSLCPTPKTFSGVDHCPMGSTVLTLTTTSLDVTGLSGANGVASDLGTSATEWQRESRIDFASGGGGYVEYHAWSGSTLASTMRLAEIAAPSGGPTNFYNLSSNFTTSVGSMTYKVELLSGGVVVATQNGLTSSDNIKVEFNMLFSRSNRKTVSPNSYGTWIALMELFGIAKVSSPTPYACQFGIRSESGTTFPSVTLPNTSVYSNIDQIVMTETTSGGSYSYHDFQRMDMFGTPVTYRITSESYK